MCDTLTKLFSTADIAAAMGVGESSVKRWIDAGTLRAEKTPGGHRRVALTDFYNFLRATGKKLVAPEVVGLPGQVEVESNSPFEVCQASLQIGDAFTFESALQLLRLSEHSAAAAFDKTVYPAFKAVRDTCRHPSEECLVLHRAVAVTQAAIKTTMSPLSDTLSTETPRVVFADIGYDVDGLPTLFAEASVWDQAQCLQLGTSVPATVIEGALDAFNASVLWLSASGPAKRSTLNADFQSILTRASQRQTKVVVFGDAVPRVLPVPVTRVASFGEFRGFVAALA
jgi:excisionase family DNA binding protein